MAWRSILVVVVAVFSFTSGYGTLTIGETPTNLTWPTEYYLKGETIYVTGGIVEPFEIWFRDENKRARKDVYGGVVKNYYQFSSSYDKTFVIHHEADQDLNVRLQCFKSMAKRPEEKTKMPYMFLPDTEDFVYEGTENYQGKDVTVWSKTESVVEKAADKIHELYVTKVGEVDIPVRHIVQSYCTNTKGLLSKVITNYYNYKPTVDKATTNVKKVKGVNIRFCEILSAKAEHVEPLDDHMDIDLDTSFHGYKKIHNKRYNKEEHETRKEIFKNNVRHIIKHNRQDYGFTLAVNQFADQSDEEIQALSCLLPRKLGDGSDEAFPLSIEELEAIAEEAPEELDRRIDGIVTPVKNQQNCGSCWAFATTAATEIALALSNGGRALDLSEQSLVDCAWSFGVRGCNGGLLENALKYVYTHGMPMESEYGLYMMEDGICHLNNVSDSDIFKIEGFGRVPPKSEAAFKAALVKHGALSVAIHASKNMALYNEGVYYEIDCENKPINHAVTVVGYGTRDNIPYWIVKNSWGTSWGESGYILLAATNNNCGLMDMGYYAIA